MKIHGYELVTDWKVSNCGKTAIAQKGGKKYILKKYLTIVAPLNNGTLDAKTFKLNKQRFDKFTDMHKRLNQKLRSISGEGGNIIAPCDEFIEENFFMEASELIPGAVPDEEQESILASLSVDTKKLLMQTAAGALYSVHKQKIVHSDLKPQNILLVRNDAGNYVAKLIDFDSSYFVDEKPEDLIGTIDYYSPELGAYGNVEDEDEMAEMAAKITEKSDIFSLGLIFHVYLTGSLPKPIDLTPRLRKLQDKGKVIYSWVALNNGCGIEVSSKIENPNHAALIRDMISIDPNDRPTSAEVLKRLRDDKKPVIEEPWPEHELIIDKAKLSASGVIGLKKKLDSGKKKYEVTTNGGKSLVLSREDLIAKGYAVPAVSHFCEPWPEHKIAFNLEKIKARGFVASEQTVNAGVKGYTLIRSDESKKFFKLDTLLLMSYAKKTEGADGGHGGGPGPDGGDGEAAKGFDSPWPEDKIEWNKEKISEKGYVSVKRSTLNGANGYSFVKSDGTKKFMPTTTALLLKLAKKL